MNINVTVAVQIKRTRSRRNQQSETVLLYGSLINWDSWRVARYIGLELAKGP